ncbi:MAG: acyl-CoA dehydrogenase family protein [Flavobacteriales bacterium]|jgi:alkylation response protein AidB-like acyl-CoA dehydrogenase|nr:acyl-CoA dehydrogenase [Flavobacteriales bacterium]MDG1916267.1 acyl-CoA dehydrogenase family protein [Flavobacteriales bacterium]|tara:strand:- start:1915 stop:3054 length:1140 start_codon:yes stop_codon:yes gene_type:complete
MDFNYNENQKLISEMIRSFSEKEIVPFMKDWDDNQTFPVAVFKKLGELGLMGVLVPQEYGGSGFGYAEYVTAIEELAKVDPSIGLSMAAHNSLCTGHIMQFGNELQKKKYLPKLATAEWIGAWGLTEHNTGSDSGGMSTTAVKDGDEWVLNGAKNFITHAISGDVAVVIVRTGEKGDSKGMSAFIVEKGTQGFSSGKKEDKLGMRASETAELVFDNCRISNDNLLGNIGEGFIQAMKVLDGGRISIAALSLGIAKGAYQAALKYSKERVQFGKPIAHHQAIAFKLADMATTIEASELLIYKAVDKKNTNQKVTLDGAMAKYYSSEVAVQVSTDAVQVLGGYGYTKDFPVERFYRDSKLCTIGEGTSEIQKIVIAKQILS